MDKSSEGIFREEFVLDLSFFNFKNAVTATFFCDPGLKNPPGKQQFSRNISAG